MQSVGVRPPLAALQTKLKRRQQRDEKTTAWGSLTTQLSEESLEESGSRQKIHPISH